MTSVLIENTEIYCSTIKSVSSEDFNLVSKLGLLSVSD